MLFIDIILTGIGLAMDAMAVSICKGLTMNKIVFKDMIIVALYFGMFQFMMPIFGYVGGFYLASIITKVDNIVAFILLSIIGINMIKEGIVGEGNNVNSDINYKVMFPLAIATSIDAFTVGISFAFLKVNLFFSTIIIGIITFILSLIGIIIGYNFGIRFQKSSLIFGGFALIIIGLKNLLYS